VKRLVPLLGAVLMLALAGTAAADRFTVARPHPHRGAGTSGVIAFTAAPSSAPIGFTAAQSGPMSFSALRGIWQAAGATYGIPWEVLGAINKVETNFGRNLGPSSAGAVGWMQFMPSTWARWGVDANGDGVADPNNPTDAIFSAARYLAACGGQTDISGAIYCYNHADWYVNDVLGLAASFSRGGGIGLFSAGQLQTRVTAAQTRVTALNKQLSAAFARAKTLAHGERLAQHKESAARLLSDQLAAHKHAVQIGIRRDVVLARIARLRGLLRSATTRLSTAQNRASSLQFMPSAGQLMSAPGGGYTGLRFGRIDQGVDLVSDRPYAALASGTVVHIDPNFWRGTPAVYERLDAPIVVGGRSYSEIFYSETEALVHVGQRLAPGQPVIAAGSAEIGFARGELPAAHAIYREGMATLAGSDFYTYLTAGNPAGRSDPMFAMLGSPLGGLQPGSGAALAFTTSSDTMAFTPGVVYFTR